MGKKIERITEDKYKQNKRDIENLTKLKITDYSEDWKIRLENINHKKIWVCLLLLFSLSAFIITAICFEPPIKLLVLSDYIFFFWALFLMLCFINSIITLGVVSISFSRLSIKRLKYFTVTSSLIPSVIYGLLWLLDSKYQNRVNLIVGIGILLSSIIIWIYIVFILKIPKYLYKEIDDGLSKILGIISAVTFIFGWNTSNKFLAFLSTLFFAGIVVSTITQLYIQKDEVKTRSLFYEELLKKKPDYEQLKRIYFSGGEEFKDKVLSNEKMLRVVIENEIELRPATSSDSDINKLFAFYQAEQQTDFTRGKIENILVNPNSICLLMEYEDKVIGFAYQITDDEGVTSNPEIIVAESYRNQGLERRLEEELQSRYSGGTD
ncbi:GNAT family N-acetyltransferase [Streptococcus sp. 27098_8_113]|uniref:GNAT family N-acetyltransferase n=1 Tax=Streptococcus sp. 27098_8_113 TaxID=3003669 RepID=UPI00352F3AAA